MCLPFPPPRRGEPGVSQGSGRIELTQCRVAARSLGREGGATRPHERLQADSTIGYRPSVWDLGSEAAVDIVYTALGVLVFAVLLPASVAWSILRRARSSQAVSVPLPNWYSDPTGRHSLRYWDGAVWTRLRVRRWISDRGSDQERRVETGQSMRACVFCGRSPDPGGRRADHSVGARGWRDGD